MSRVSYGCIHSPPGRSTLGLGQPGPLTCPFQALSREPPPLRGLPSSDLTLESSPGLRHVHGQPSGSASPARDPGPGGRRSVSRVVSEGIMFQGSQRPSHGAPLLRT